MVVNFVAYFMFLYHLKQHYSQTTVGVGVCKGLFLYHLKQHYSQTFACGDRIIS